jgi:RNA methyltransferase, TrmH family
MSVSQLTSKDNPLIKTIRLVSAGSKRAPETLVLAEGIRVLEEAVKSGHQIEAAVFAESFGATERERDLLESWRSTKVRIYRVSDKIFKTASSVQTPQGALALVRVRNIGLAGAAPAQNALIVYACGIQDPGNLGTLIRTAAAAGATMVCTEKGTVSARNPKTIRASAGAFFHLVPVENVDVDEFLEYCRRYSIQPYRTDAREGIHYYEKDLRSPCAIMLGNEGSGMNTKKLAGVPPIRIPMNENIESLNVASAGAVVLFEAAKQRSCYD